MRLYYRIVIGIPIRVKKQQEVRGGLRQFVHFVIVDRSLNQHWWHNRDFGGDGSGDDTIVSLFPSIRYHFGEKVVSQFLHAVTSGSL
jgi:hypothetical protein